MRMIMVAAAAALVAATPAAAQDTTAETGTTFTGPRVGVNLGFADDDVFGTETFTYGVEAGYDADLGGAVVGGSVELQDSKDTDREIALTARVGAKPSPNFLVYGLAGYTNLKVFDGLKLDGYRVGAGIEFGFNRNGFAKVEQRYSNYELGVDGFQTVVGVGVRF
ncbi:outer membrane beta-barrel protein [Sphingomonas arenae]|uniref:outer membrane beta-barrel protein n=1 Tax=Sphingomonas arenae TaxID=2812555 RepID=UPI0019676B19|nr:outer membrane beta-barrel protein [Sphingomonas arenae]